MARSSRGGGGGSRRPAVAPARPAPAQQKRPATTAAYPPAKTNAGPPAAPAAGAPSVGPGLFGQMASTAAGVAVGSSIGHAIGGFFGGGSSLPAEQQPKDNGAVQAQQGQTSESNSWGARDCGVDAKQFTKCLDENQGNMQICGWYLEQLKACQQAASNY
ncbi:hypothetical protein BJ878DRAFT_506977 [Calycina marina]|uniref:CHCH domain-containing protein n=1 Tax=Calycina marina TaxID=1763456 RepID=A0A9P7Z292_9HELO|nr:hypothetical protein BJ878DRAFT_506977 [Calycina marina]